MFQSSFTQDYIGKRAEMEETKEKTTTNMEYLTWRELRDKLNEVTDDKVLDEPALFAYCDNYFNETLVPVQLIQDTWHIDDQPRTVAYNGGSEQFGRMEDLDDDDVIPLRKLPRNALLLSYSEMDEDLDETIDWLKAVKP